MTPDVYVTNRSRQLGATGADIRGPRRFQRLVTIRAQIARELRSIYRMTLPEIGKFLGGRNHATVIWLLRGGRRKTIMTRGGWA